MLNKNLLNSLSDLKQIKSYPELPCPYCGNHKLKLDLSTFQYKNLTGSVLKNYNEKYNFKKVQQTIANSDESTFIKLLTGTFAVIDVLSHTPVQFTAFFQCDICSSSVASLGLAKVQKNKEKLDLSTDMEIKVLSFNPPIPIFELQESTPESINNELLHVFNYFHSDISSSGSKLRRAIEHLCFELGCNHKNLHRNIQELSKQYPQEAKWLESLKLVGNEATHSGGVSEKDIIDSLQILEVILDIFRRNEIEPLINQTALLLENKYTKTSQVA